MSNKLEKFEFMLDNVPKITRLDRALKGAPPSPLSQWHYVWRGSIAIGFAIGAATFLFTVIFSLQYTDTSKAILINAIYSGFVGFIVFVRLAYVSLGEWKKAEYERAKPTKIDPEIIELMNQTMIDEYEYEEEPEDDLAEHDDDDGGDKVKLIGFNVNKHTVRYARVYEDTDRKVFISSKGVQVERDPRYPNVVPHWKGWGISSERAGSLSRSLNIQGYTSDSGTRKILNSAGHELFRLALEESPDIRPNIEL